MQKKITFFILLVSSFLVGSAQAEVVLPTPAPPNVAAKAYILMDYDTGRILVAKNADEKLPPASLTKLMTSYVASAEIDSKQVSLDDKVHVSEKAWRMPGSRTFLKVNTDVPLKTLMKGMIVQSGNDAVIAIAEHIAGTEGGFVQLMNQYAKRLGLKNTHYVDATGLPVDNHYSTAHDIALLSRAVIKDFPDHYAWYSIKDFTYNKIKQNNRNRLLWRDPSVDGLKTGHTDAAGYCLAASAKRGDMRLISVVLGTDSDNARATESAKLLNYGFRFYETHKIYPANTKITQTKVWKGERDEVALGVVNELATTVQRGQSQQLQTTTHIDRPVIAPIKKGQQLGTVEVRLGDKVLATAPLVALSDVPEGGWWHRMIDSSLLWF